VRKPVALLIFWMLNCIILYVASVIFPQSYELGTYRISELSSAIFAGFSWTALVWIGKQILKRFGVKLAKEKERVVYYYIPANFIALWLISRFSYFFGFGIVSFWWALLLGVAAAFLQFGVWRLVKKGK